MNRKQNHVESHECDDSCNWSHYQKFPQFGGPPKTPFWGFHFPLHESKHHRPFGQIRGCNRQFCWKGTLAFHMFLVRPTATWHVHPFCQQSMSGHKFPTFRNWVFLIINKTNTTTPDHSKPWIMFLHQFLHHWKPPCLTWLWPFPGDVYTMLNTVRVYDTATDILFHGSFSLLRKGFLLSFTSLVDVLHHWKRSTNRRKPNMFWFIMVDVLNDFVYSLVGTQIILIEKWAASGRSLVTFLLLHGARQHTVGRTCHFQQLYALVW